jgi:APA family basic amino acid/polyamine antiporter
MMAVEQQSVMQRMFARKTIAQVQRESANSELKRSLGKWNLLLLGVGCIIGAGIFVRTGSAAALHAGPAVMLSFVVAGIVCAFAGLCYAELSSTLPVSGSAYTYSYTTLGEFVAWIMGALLLLEYGLAASVVAVGWRCGDRDFQLASIPYLHDACVVADGWCVRICQGEQRHRRY